MSHGFLALLGYFWIIYVQHAWQKDPVRSQVQKGPQCRSHDLDPQGEAPRAWRAQGQGKYGKLLVVFFNGPFNPFDVFFHDLFLCPKELDEFWTSSFDADEPELSGASDDGLREMLHQSQRYDVADGGTLLFRFVKRPLLWEARRFDMYLLQVVWVQLLCWLHFDCHQVALKSLVVVLIIWLRMFWFVLLGVKPPFFLPTPFCAPRLWPWQAAWEHPELQVLGVLSHVGVQKTGIWPTNMYSSSPTKSRWWQGVSESDVLFRSF